MYGTITKGVGGFYTVFAEDKLDYVCKARGLFRKNGETPVPGDRVEFSVDTKGDGYLLRISARQNQLVRPMVANIDMLLIVVSAEEPQPDLELADKLLLYCAKQHIMPVIVINKCDDGENEAARRIERQYADARYKIVTVSAATGFGIDKLSALLDGSTICLAGQSAVGKSSLLNGLLGLKLETGELSPKTERGRHTTRHAELLKIPSGGLIADTPGFSMLDSIPVEPEEIPSLYPEFLALDGMCRFTSCMHISEPHCAVKAAVDAGKIPKERYERYVKIANEAIKSRRHRYD